MLIDAVLLIVFADPPALPALDAHKFMLDLWQSQPRQHRTNEPGKNARTTAECNTAVAARAGPYRGKISIKTEA